MPGRASSLCTEQMLMMAPRRAGSCGGRRPGRRGRRCRGWCACSRDQSASAKSSSGVRCWMPALLTRISIGGPAPLGPFDGRGPPRRGPGHRGGAPARPRAAAVAAGAGRRRLLGARRGDARRPRRRERRGARPRGARRGDGGARRRPRGRPRGRALGPGGPRRGRCAEPRPRPGPSCSSPPRARGPGREPQRRPVRGCRDAGGEPRGDRPAPGSRPTSRRRRSAIRPARRWTSRSTPTRG